MTVITPQVPDELPQASTLASLSPLETERLTKVLVSNGITLADAIADFGADADYGITMAKLISRRDNAAFAARKDDTVSSGQRDSLKAHRALALHRGDTDLAGKINALLVNFDATYAKASQALDICFDVQGKPGSEFYPKREGSKSASNGNVGQASKVDIAGMVPDEAV